MSSRYNAADIEVLSGLDPVKRRPGMYTDTARPNHLAQEVIDNSVDEAMAGYAKSVGVPAARLSVIVSGALMVVGSLSIILGVWGDLGSLLILVAVAPIAFLMHRFWTADGEARMNEQIQFNKTLSLAGGALALFALFALVPELGLTVTGPLF